MIDPGQMDRTVELLQQVVTKSATTGAPVKSYTHLDDVMAHVGFVSAREMLKAGAIVSESVLVVTIYWRGDVTGASEIGYRHRVKYDGNEYDIIGIEERGYKQLLKLTARLAK